MVVIDTRAILRGVPVSINPLSMTAPRTTITHTKPLHDRWLRLTFADGAVHEVDLTPVFEAGGIFSALRDDPSLFGAVEVATAFNTIAWPGGIDLDPDVLRGDHSPASGRALPRRVVQPA